MKVALIQLDIAWEDRQRNYRKAELFAQMASADNCDVMVLPEMFNTGFSMDLSAVADEDISETTSALSGIAKTYSVNIIAGFPMKSPAEQKGRNMAVAFDKNGMLISTYTKIHPFSLVGEEEFYIAGDNISLFNISGIPASMFICYDLRFPEIFRKIARQVQLIFVIANWSAARKAHWETLLRARAIENQCFVIGVNRIGTDANGIHYTGASCVIGPEGNVLCSGDDMTEYLVCEFDPSEVASIRSEYPFLKDMKIYAKEK
jgi:omega-amidase